MVRRAHKGQHIWGLSDPKLVVCQPLPSKAITLENLDIMLALGLGSASVTYLQLTIKSIDNRQSVTNLSRCLQLRAFLGLNPRDLLPQDTSLALS